MCASESGSVKPEVRVESRLKSNFGSWAEAASATASAAAASNIFLIIFFPFIFRI